MRRVGGSTVHPRAEPREKPHVPPAARRAGLDIASGLCHPLGPGRESDPVHEYLAVGDVAALLRLEQGECLLAQRQASRLAATPGKLCVPGAGTPSRSRRCR